MTDDLLREAYVHCGQLAREHARDRWLSALFAPEPVRPHMNALAAFFLEIGRVPARVREPLAGEMRLTWWRELIEGAREAEAASNPVAAALIDTIRTRRLPLQAFEDYLLGWRDDLYREPPTPLAEIEAFGRNVMAAEFHLSALVLERGCEPLAASASAGAAAALFARGGAEAVAPALAHVAAAEMALRALPAGVAPAFAPLACLRLDLKRRARGKPPAAPWRRQAAIWWWGRGR